MKDVILYRYFSNEATSEEVQQIEEWLKADPAHQQEFDAAHMLFNVMTLRQPRAEGLAARKKPVGGLLRRLGRVALRSAAMVALLIGAGYMGARLMRGNMNDKMAARTNVLEVPAGQRISVTLEDGTVVWLNGGTRLEYPLLFAEEVRRVKLSGEALFDVEHNADHPFVVETFASEIEVLGTKFNVYADEKAGCFSTTLAEGRIRATNLMSEDREQVTLNPNEMVRLVDGRLVSIKTEARDAICWTEGYINIGHVAFDELMRRFENAYDVKIVIARESLPVVGYASGKIRVAEGIDFALQLLQQACDFTYEEDPETHTITIR